MLTDPFRNGVHISDLDGGHPGFDSTPDVFFGIDIDQEETLDEIAEMVITVFLPGEPQLPA